MSNSLTHGLTSASSQLSAKQTTRLRVNTPATPVPVHTVYGGAQIFKSDTARKLGDVGLQCFLENAWNFVEFARAIQLHGYESLPKSATQIAALTKQLKKNPDAVKQKTRGAWLAYTICNRVIGKLKTEPVEDFRIDFEAATGTVLTRKRTDTQSPPQKKSQKEWAKERCRRSSASASNL